MRLIDTSVWIGALDRQGNVAIRETVRGMLDRSEAVICSPVVFEVLRGLGESGEFETVQGHLAKLTSLPVDWLEAARWASQPPVKPLKIKAMDLLIAHTAFVHDAVLVHADADFDRLAGFVPLQTESYVSAVRRTSR